MSFLAPLDKPGAPRDLVKEPSVFVLEYNDGLRAAAFLMTGMVEDFTVATDGAEMYESERQLAADALKFMKTEVGKRWK